MRGHLSLKSLGLIIVCALLGSCTGKDQSSLVDPVRELTSIRVTPDSTNVRTGQIVQLVAQPFDASGEPITSAERVTWTSGDTTAAVVDSTGRVTTRSNGPVRITAWIGTVSGRATINVIPATAGRVVFDADTATLFVGEWRSFRAIRYDDQGFQRGSNDLTWSVTDTTVLSTPAIDAVQGRQMGNAYLIATYTATGAADSVRIVVAPGGPPLLVSPDTNALLPGLTRQLRARVQPHTGPARDTSGVAWSVADSLVATVDAGGLVTARAPGRTTVTGALGGMQASVIVNVWPSMALEFAAVATGLDHACGLTADGTAYCWGNNVLGALGTGQSADRCGTNACAGIPVAVDGGLRFTSITAGDEHTCGLTSDGTAYCWGSNRTVPTRVAGGIVFTELDAGSGHTCGVSRSGAAYCWGGGLFGVLGTGNETDQPQPAPVAGGITFAHISVEALHACGVATDGVVYCWGRNELGDLGIGPDVAICGSDIPCAKRPTAVQGTTRFKSVATGAMLSCAVATDSTVWCWGTGILGQLGNGTHDGSRVPALVGGDLRAQQVAVEYRGQHACAVATDGGLRCWGYGSGDLPTRRFPTFVFTQIDLGVSFGCGMATDRRAYCWGASNAGQLGNAAFPNELPAPDQAAAQRVAGQR